MKKRMIVGMIIVCAAVATTITMRLALAPDFGVLRIGSTETQMQIATYPLHVPTSAQNVMMELSFRLPRFGMTKWQVHVDDCLDEISLNGSPLPSSSLPQCDIDTGTDVDMHAALRGDANQLRLRVRDNGGDLRLWIRPGFSVLGWVLTTGMPLLVALLAMAWMVHSWVKRSAQNTGWLLLAVAMAGIALRLYYIAETPFTERGHDIFAHTDYIEYVESEWSIPLADDGWEYHQPPLYYFASAAYSALARGFGLTTDAVRYHLRWMSGIMVIIAFLFSVWSAFLLFPEKTSNRRALFLLQIATLPGLLFISSRISNDPLFLLLGFAAFPLLLRWWKHGKDHDWYGLSALVSIGFLTKFTAVLFLPIAGLSLLLRRALSWRKKLRLGLGACLIALVLCGWLVGLRMSEPSTDRITQFGNIGLDPVVILPNVPLNFFIIRPAEVLRWPYNNPWTDEAGRQFYWEYYLKSVLFGEWNFGPQTQLLAQVLLVLGSGMLLLMLIGIVHDLRRRPYQTIPILATLAVFQAASIAYRVLHTCSCNQDFRFVPILALPAAYYIVRSVDAMPTRVRSLASAWILSFCLLCALFVLWVA